MSGLIACDSFEQAVCWTKLVETICSCLILIAAIYQIIMNLLMYGKLIFTFVLFIELFMAISLLFNILHDILGPSNPFLTLEILFTNIFFLTLIYFVGFNTFKNQHQRKILLIVYLAVLGIYIAIAIQRSIQNNGTAVPCTQTWFLVVDSIAICLSLFLFIAYRMKQKSQQDISSEYFQQSLVSHQIKSPFLRMWIMIGSNILCSMINLGRTIALVTNNTCVFSEDKNIQAITNIVFVFCSYYLGFIITLIVLMLIRIDQSRLLQDQNFQMRSHANSNGIEINGNNLQLIDRTSIASRVSSV